MMLHQDEKITCEISGKLSIVWNVMLIIIGILLLPVGIGIFFLIAAIYAYYDSKTKYFVTNKRFVIEKWKGGTTEVPLSKVESINVSKSGTGLVITGSGGHVVNVRLEKEGVDQISQAISANIK